MRHRLGDVARTAVRMLQMVFLPVSLLVATTLAAAPAHRDVPTRLPELITEGTPRGLVTVVVPVPEELRDADDVSFEVRVSGGMEVLGRLSGLATVRGAPARPLVLTLRIPAGADAGSVGAADVHFRAASGREVIVPVVVRVTLVRNVAILGPREMRGLRLGDRLELVYRVVNAGNATDTLMIDARGPLGWMVRLGRPARVVVPPRGQVEVPVHASIPSTANIGDHTLSVSLRTVNSINVLGAVHTTLGIIGRAGDVAGVVLTPVMAVATSNVGSAFFTGATLEGTVAANTYLRAQFSPAAAQGGIVSQGLSSVGAFSAPFNATLGGGNWDIAAGNVGLQLTDLTGVNVMGQGVSARAERDRYQARGIVARPGSTRGAKGSLVGAGLWRTTAFGRVGGSVSHFAEQNGFGSDRELMALGADFTTNPIGTVTIESALAHRSAPTASGLGYGVAVSHERSGERVRLRVSHAPGGTAAFARATDELQFEFNRTFSERWSGDVSALRSDDAGPVFSEMLVSSFSVGSRYLLNPKVQLSLRGNASSFDARSATGSIGDFGADDQSFTAGGEWRHEALSITAEGSYGQVARRTALFDGSDFTAVAAQRGLRVGVSRAFDRWGAVDGNAGIEMTDAGVGIPGQMLNASVRWSNIPIVVLDRQIRLNTEAAYQRFGGLRGSLVTRSSVALALPFGLDLAMSAERNPFFRDVRGRAGWIAAMRVSASARVFSAQPLGPAGSVFEDRNLNGVRDDGEPGVAGVVVRRGEASARTDRQGSYRLAVNARGATRIQQASLPLGLVSHPLLATDSVERHDLPVLPTGTVLVDLELVADEGGRVPQVDLEPAVVILRDATGFEWVGHRTSPTRASFEGIPVGAYTVIFNGARLREQLRAEEQSLVLRPRETQSVTTQLRSRAVRIFVPQNRSRSQAQPQTRSR